MYLTVFDILAAGGLVVFLFNSGVGLGHGVALSNKLANKLLVAVADGMATRLARPGTAVSRSPTTLLRPFAMGAEAARPAGRLLAA